MSWRMVALMSFVAVASGQEPPELERQVTELRALVLRLQARVDELEAKVQGGPPAVGSAPAVAAQTVAGPPPESVAAAPPPEPGTWGLPSGTSFNLLFDGYYGFNFNSPIGRVNRLRAYDVSSNSFSINQAAIIVENAADPEHHKHWGARLDLQWGQATETLQGNPLNEPRPEIYRNIFQAYGTVVVPLHHNGLTIDFGKFASSLGLEGNYTKDQMNYSRSFWFDYLPFYHEGVRVNYKINDRIAANYWATNGTQQTEAFNNFKDQFAGVLIQPTKNVSWNVNYYLGQEHNDVIFYPNGAPAGLTDPPNQQGVIFQPISKPPTGRLHIFDTYATWQVTPAVTVAAEADYVIQRLYKNSAPDRVTGGAGYFRDQLSPNLAIALRGEYLYDRGGMFSGASQVLREGTVTLEYKFGKDFLLRGEWRTDFSNRPYFYTDTLGVLSKHQNTATLGAVWWFGTKQGTW